MPDPLAPSLIFQLQPKGKPVLYPTIKFKLMNKSGDQSEMLDFVFNPTTFLNAIPHPQGGSRLFLNEGLSGETSEIHVNVVPDQISQAINEAIRGRVQMETMAGIAAQLKANEEIQRMQSPIARAVLGG